MSGPEDDPRDDAPHAECAHEIERLGTLLAAAEDLNTELLASLRDAANYIAHSEFCAQKSGDRTCNCGAQGALVRVGAAISKAKGTT